MMKDTVHDSYDALVQALECEEEDERRRLLYLFALQCHYEVLRSPDGVICRRNATEKSVELLNRLILHASDSPELVEELLYGDPENPHTQPIKPPTVIKPQSNGDTT